MLRSLLSAGLVAVLVCGLTGSLRAQGKKTWQEDQLRRLSGRWTTLHEQKDAAGRPLRTRVDLEFAEGKLNVFVLDESGTRRLFDGQLKVIGVKESEGPGIGWFARLSLGGSNEIQRAEAYYDFVGEKLILVGRVGWRPWEGFHLSGEYRRAEKPK